MSSVSDASGELAKVKHKRHRDSSRSIHPYFGKVDPALSLKAISTFSSPGGLVLDPFCGSGTVVHDALLLQRSALAWDSSPLAALIASSKVLGVLNTEAAEVHDFVERFASEPNLFSHGTRHPKADDAAALPAMPRVRSVSDWFNSNALLELAQLRLALRDSEGTLSAEAHHLLRLTFSRIIVAASNQQGESTYRKVEKPNVPGRVLRLFRDAAASTLKAARAFSLELEQTGISVQPGRLSRHKSGYTIRHGDLTASIEVQDSRELVESVGALKAQLVTTSPPYLMSWDYGLYHKFRFYWLDFDLDIYEESEIGRHLRRKDDDVERYRSDMLGVFRRLHQATDSDATLVMVNAPSIVYGEEVNTNAILTDLASSAGWSLRWSGNTIDIPGPHHGMYGSLSTRGAVAPGEPGKMEHVLVFTRQSDPAQTRVGAAASK